MRYLPDINEIVAQLLHNSLQRVLLGSHIVIIHGANFVREEMGTPVDFGVREELWAPLGDRVVESCEVKVEFSVRDTGYDEELTVDLAVW